MEATEVRCDLSLLIVPGSAKCLTHFRGFEQCCRNCNLAEKIEKLINPSEEEKLKLSTVYKSNYSRRKQAEAEPERDIDDEELDDVSEPEPEVEAPTHPVVTLNFIEDIDQELLEIYRRECQDLEQDIIALMHLYASEYKLGG